MEPTPCNEAFQGVNVTSDITLKSSNTGISNKLQANGMRYYNSTVT